MMELYTSGRRIGLPVNGKDYDTLLTPVIFSFLLSIDTTLVQMADDCIEWL
ncbi:MAG: hypothetical protein RRA35_06645 [Desulfomonilia bacterium]|nr:hypothetical protein [Desulfomonilia bacterium]